MESIKLYTSVAIVGALADVATNALTKNATSGMALGLKQFYSTAPAIQTALFAALTFVVVLFIADALVTLIFHKKQAQ